MGSNVMLSIHITKRYPDFDLEISQQLDGGLVALFGPSGSGKTTTLNCIAGLLMPDSGEVRFDDRVLFSSSARVNVPPEKRGFGYIFQDSLLFPHLDVRRNLEYGWKLKPPGDRKLDLDRIIGLLSLEPLLSRKPVTLSGGERQRVALARALATCPDLLLLDEPLNALDLPLRGKVLHELKRVHRELGIPMLYVSHSISEVLALADRALVLERGRAIAYDAPQRVLYKPGVFPLLEPTGLENSLEVSVVSQDRDGGLTEMRLGEQRLRVPYVDRSVGQDVLIAIRASDVILAAQPPTGLSARNVLRGRIEGLHPVGPRVLVYLDVGQRLIVEVTPEAARDLDLHSGRDVHAIIKSNSILMLT